MLHQSTAGTVGTDMFFGPKEADIMVSKQGHRLQPHLVAAQPSPQVHRYSLVFLSLLRDDVTLRVDCSIRIMMAAFYPRCWRFSDDQFVLWSTGTLRCYTENGPLAPTLCRKETYKLLVSDLTFLNADYAPDLKYKLAQSPWKPIECRIPEGLSWTPRLEDFIYYRNEGGEFGSYFTSIWPVFCRVRLNNLFSRRNFWIQLQRSVCSRWTDWPLSTRIRMTSTVIQEV